MTTTTTQIPSLPLASSDGSSSTSSSEPLFGSLSGGQDQEFSISMPAGSVSFDWSDFPVVHQYNGDMPAPPAPSSFSFPALQYSNTPLTSRSGCSLLAVRAKPAWEAFDDDTASLSVSSDEETVAASSQQENASKRNTTRRVIKFSDVLEIRSHAVVLSSHPCSSGLALELSWEPYEVEVLDFEAYENSRQFQRRHMSHLRLTYWERKRLLEKSTGLSEQELVLIEQRSWREELFPSHQNKESSSNKDKAPICPVKAAASAFVLKKVASAESLSAFLMAC